jgi:hypothetical protein
MKILSKRSLCHNRVSNQVHTEYKSRIVTTLAAFCVLILDGLISFFLYTYLFSQQLKQIL